MNILRINVLFIALVVTMALVGCSKSTPAEALLNDIVTAYGGEAELKKLDKHTQEWAIESALRGDKGLDIRYIELPDKLRVELLYSRSVELRVINNDKGYRASEQGGPFMVEGPPLIGMMLQRMRFYSPLTLLDKKASITLSEEEGLKLITIKEGELTGTYYVNPETKMIVKYKGFFELEGRMVDFVTEYSDFKKINGVVFPHKENKFAMGMNTGILELKSVVYEDEYSLDTFQVPPVVAE